MLNALLVMNLEILTAISKKSC